MIIKVNILGCPVVSMNSRFSALERANQIRAWRKIAFFSFIKTRPPKPFKKARIKIVRYFSGQNKYRDYDNLVSSMKPLIDGAVDARILTDDNYQVTGKWDVDQVLCEHDYVMIEIEEITNREENAKIGC